MELKIEYLSKEELKPYANNAKIHTAEQVEQIKNSIKEFGFNDPIAIWHDNEIIEGHGRLLAVMEMPEIETVPVIRLDDLTDEERKAYTLVHNKLTMNTGFDDELLSLELESLPEFDAEFYGFEINTDAEYDPGEERKGSMSEKYLAPPFSVLYGTTGEWLARKRAWVNMGIRSELGRGGTCLQFKEQSRGKLHTRGGYTRSEAKRSRTTTN